jgi:hypothetical protein
MMTEELLSCIKCKLIKNEFHNVSKFFDKFGIFL